MTDTFTDHDLERLAARLDPVCSELDERDQKLLHAIFAAAGEAARADEPEVAGYSFSWGALLPAVQKPEVQGTQGVLIGLNQSYRGGFDRSMLNPQPLPP